MQGRGANFIPRYPGKRGWISEKDTRFLNYEEDPDFAPTRKGEKAKTTVGRFREQIIAIFGSLPYCGTVASDPKRDRDEHVSENFGNAWVWVSDTPITLNEWEKYNKASFSYVFSGNFYTYLKSLKTTQRYATQGLYRYPNTVERVKWFVTFCCGYKRDEILGMYCYQDRQAIEELTGFLRDTQVSNEGDKNEAIISLSELYHQLS